MVVNLSVFTAAVIILVPVTACLPCSPGFVPQGNSCVCAEWPEGMIACDEDSQRASMQIGYCVTYDNETSEVRAGRCLQSFFRSDSRKFFYPLPTEVSDLNDQVCGPSNSEGFLCGECRDGFTISPLSTIHCINCTGASHSQIKYVAFTYLPITVIFVIILTFSISVTSGPINSFVFFAQLSASNFYQFAYMASVLDAQSNTNGTFSSRISTMVITAFYDVWNLNIFTTFIFPFCLTHHLSRLQAFTLKYVLAFYPLILVVLPYICIQLHAHDFRPVVYCWKPFLKCFLRFKRSVDPKTSVIDAFATFFLLSYVKLLSIAGLILLPIHVYNHRGEKISRIVMYFSTRIEFFHTEHLPLALFSVFVSLTFITIPPTLLIFYPTSFFQKCLTRCKVNSLALRTLVETFQGCYKDGTNGTRDYRYFAGLYFILRIIFVLLNYASAVTFINVSAGLCCFTALLFAFLKPYKKKIYNIVDTLIFSLMGTMYFIISCHLQHILVIGTPSTRLSVLVDVLYTFPLLYIVCFMVWWLLDRKTKCVQRLKSCKCLNRFFQDQDEPRREYMDFDAAVPHRLQYPEQYESRIQCKDSCTKSMSDI